MSAIEQAVAAVKQLSADEIARRLNELREEEKALIPLYKSAVKREREAKRFQDATA